MNPGEQIPDEWIAAFQSSLAAFQALILEPPVVRAWAEPSNLDGYTIGGIAGHVLSLMTGLQLRLETGARDIDTIRYTDWYRQALSSAEIHSGLVSAGEDLAATGPDKVAEDIEQVGAAIVRRLRHLSRDFLIPLTSISGSGVRLADFLRTRFVEITVHAYDIASSIVIPTPAFPGMAWMLAAEVVAETTGRDGSDAAFVLATTRPHRTAPA